MSSLKDIIDSGYRKTSNKHKMVSRIDREDWKEFMAKSHSPWSLEEGMKWIENLGGRAPDFYRRCHSKDMLTINDSVIFKKIPASGFDKTEFCKKVI